MKPGSFVRLTLCYSTPVPQTIYGVVVHHHPLPHRGFLSKSSKIGLLLSGGNYQEFFLGGGDKVEVLG